MRVLLMLSLLAATSVVRADEPWKFEMKELDPHVGNVCYAVTTADVNGDGKTDVIALTEDSVVCFENPSWKKQVLISGKTERDNVCIQPRDIDGDGRVDFAIGAAWRPSDTQGGGTLQWITRGTGDEWTVRPIGSEPTLHRMRWGDVKGNGHQQLVVAPLQGRGTKGPKWNEGQGCRILVFDIPDDPAKAPWPSEVADDSLHTTHNLEIVDFDGDGRNEILIAAWEGVFVLKRGDDGKWSKKKIGAGNQETTPFKGASEVKLGKLGNGLRYVATIEPWHGFQAIAYTPPESSDGLWTRNIVDEPLTWGHAVWIANLDGDADEELIIGQRDPGTAPAWNDTKGPGVFVYDPRRNVKGLGFTKFALDDGGVACEDLVSADLDGDGKNDIIAGGRATHNVRIYMNRTGSK
jgi:hypothetical protein